MYISRTSTSVVKKEKDIYWDNFIDVESIVDFDNDMQTAIRLYPEEIENYKHIQLVDKQGNVLRYWCKLGGTQWVRLIPQDAEQAKIAQTWFNTQVVHMTWWDRVQLYFYIKYKQIINFFSKKK